MEQCVYELETMEGQFRFIESVGRELRESLRHPETDVENLTFADWNLYYRDGEVYSETAPMRDWENPETQSKTRFLYEAEFQATLEDVLTEKVHLKLEKLNERGESLWLEVEPSGEDNGNHFDGSGYEVVHLSGGDTFAYRSSTHSQDGDWAIDGAAEIAKEYVRWLGNNWLA